MLVLVAAFWVAPQPAAALDSLIRVDSELGYAGYAEDAEGKTRRVHGAGAGLDVSWGFNDFLAVRGGYRLGAHRGRGAFDTHALSIGGRYLLDVFEYVPWIDVSYGLYFSEGDGGFALGQTTGVITGFGVDRLLDPDWSVGAVVRYHRVLNEERYPAYLSVSLRLGYRWTFGDPLAP